MTGLDGFLPEALKQAIELAHESKTTLLGLMAAGIALSEGARLAVSAWSTKNGVHRKRHVIWSASFREPEGPNGPVIVSISPEGDEEELNKVFGNPTVERAIVTATRKTKNGVLRLKNPKHHERMMDTLEALVRGNEPAGNAALRHGRPTNDDNDAIMPTYFTEEGEEDNPDDHLAMVRVILVAREALKGDLQKEAYRKRLRPEFDQYKSGVDMLRTMADEVNAPSQEHRGTAAVRYVTIHTAK